MESDDDERKQQMIKKGLYYGYPLCCIRQFLESRDDFDVRERASMYTGFIPCTQHALAIVAKTITLESLIQNRKHPRPFPNGD